MTTIPKRQTAYKFWIADIVNSQLIKAQVETEFDHFLIHNKKTTRVNIIATIIQKYENNEKTYLALTLDDSSGTMRVKTWREDINLASDFNIGDTILIVGRLRSYNDENYITPEFIKLIENANWQTLRKLELKKIYGEPKSEPRQDQEPPAVVEEEVVDESENNRKIIFNLIEKYNSEKGADLSLIISESKISEEEADLVIQELLKEGEIFQPSNGRVKIIE